MPNQYLNPDVLFPSLQYGFSQGVIASGTKTLYLAGQTAWDPQQNIIGGRDLGQQTRQALRNVFRLKSRYRKVAIRFEQLRLMITPRESRGADATE